ncbi:UDP-N-acetylglucosamine--N-acetylmuramyl-(pentapeptide) pyrophosphoryl-undecaprenol N-acetylglucosamine transferase [Lysinibacter cavernae]|uniref:UDP-N-acetylglucosamine--N-acetylmuramyl-(pentapeptide) pyrophosphoryl-undecaprenol N-acetylglucosamine transferase n=1 Tax=Lysinibacter cavernae TaxID=1640652 RepID=A0A7X5QZY9_9MICO|nr:UDP-N-acetylglucosamine--N-acetylmuramyl-(pentapeptide) pyrophosphoryl-undecaprenol N-acetylglucosamine transferase [Lysinibacter cavernae]NIH53089.1 UDP-N-acetylglucosamine--N-acetylmuramyl-(pentapeptide) pyrophosphoryl-undecaprenol N-acetylglucosamine transferase [Lysinibacter cavernae]
MTTYLLAGGGTAGHVNPLLAVADELRATEPESTILVLGTAEGLEARLVPERGYELLTIARVPFPRRPNAAAVTFVPRYLGAVKRVREIITANSVDVVVGFGGYASAPAYRAARQTKTPYVIHEANAKPGMANASGARNTPFVGVAFEGTKIAHARFVGMPLRSEIATLDRAATRAEARAYFGLEADRPTILVTGGSQGARQINRAVADAAPALIAAGNQILHVWGQRTEIEDPEIEHYSIIPYCDRMDLALAAADLAISRSGAATASELTGLGIPAVYVPYPHGNGEQRFNVAGVVEAGGAMLVEDAQLTGHWLIHNVLPLLEKPESLAAMGERAAAVGVLDGTQRTVRLVHEALGR